MVLSTMHARILTSTSMRVAQQPRFSPLFNVSLSCVVFICSCKEQTPYSNSSNDNAENGERQVYVSRGFDESHQEHSKYLWRVKYRIALLLEKLRAMPRQINYELKTSSDVRQIAVAPDGTVLADTVKDMKRTLIRWAMREGRLNETNSNRDFIVTSMLLASKGGVLRYIARGNERYDVVLEESDGGEHVISTGRYDRGWPAVLACSYGGACIFCATPGGCRMWNSGEVWELNELSSFQGHLGAVAVHPDGRWIARTASGWHVELQSLDDDAGAKELVGLPNFEVYDLEFSSCGKYLAAAGEEDLQGERVRIWNWKDGEIILDRSGPGQIAKWIQFSTSGELLATANSDSIVTILDVAKGEAILQFIIQVEVTGGMAFTQDDKLLVVGCQDGIRAFSLESGSEMKQ